MRLLPARRFEKLSAERTELLERGSDVPAQQLVARAAVAQQSQPAVQGWGARTYRFSSVPVVL